MKTYGAKSFGEADKGTIARYFGVEPEDVEIMYGSFVLIRW